VKEKTTTTCTIYPDDLVKVRAYREKFKQKNLADVIRIAIEFSEAHGAFK
jgi:hypothetical protein